MHLDRGGAECPHVVGCVQVLQEPESKADVRQCLELEIQKRCLGVCWHSWLLAWVCLEDATPEEQTMQLRS